MNSISRGYLLFTVFVSGMASLAVEISASRLLGNIFGASNLVWANIIGLMLLYLAAGYFIGGRWADRSPHPRMFYWILLAAAFLIGVVPLVARPILRLAAQAVLNLNLGVVGGSFLGVLALFSAPVTLLGCASPFAIRLAITDPAQAGQVSGQIYAISTFGSLIGTFLPVLVLIPAIGTALTFLTFAAALFVVALIGLWRAPASRGGALMALAMPLVVGGLAAFTLSGPIKPVDGLIYEKESAYNLIQVVQFGSTRYLLLNEGQGLHSIYDEKELITRGPWPYFLAAPFFNAAPHTPQQVDSLALVGLAAGTIPKLFTAVYGPQVHIDGIEIDPGIVQAGRAYFAMNEPNLNVIVADGRWALNRLTRRYAVIGVDAYRVPYIPWHLTTREFFEEVRARLQDDGVLVINVGRAPNDRRLVEAMAGTLQSVFPSVHVVDVPATFNTIVYATAQPTAASNLRANLDQLPLDAHLLLRATLIRAIDGLQATPPQTEVFTDDRAPVEWISDSIVLNFFLRGGFEQLK